MKTIFLKRFLVVSLLAVFFITCSQNKEKKEPSIDAQRGSVLRINLVTDPSSLDPRQEYSLSGVNVIKMLFEGLMCASSDGKATKALAGDVKCSKDGLHYIFTLKESMWNDGKPVTAHDFEYAWKSSLAPDFPSYYAYALYAIKNAKKAKLGKLSLEDVGVKAIDDLTLQVELEVARPYFLQLMTLPIFYPIPKHKVQEDAEWGMGFEKGLVSNGPFSFESWDLSHELKVKRNDLYWNRKMIALEGISMVMVDENTEMLMFEAEELDWVGSPLSMIPSDALPTLKRIDEVNIVPALGTHFYCFNVTQAPFNNCNMRRAFSYALNRHQIVDHILQGGQQVATGFIPPPIRLQKRSFFQDNLVRSAQVYFQHALSEMKMTEDELNSITLMYSNNDRSHKLAQAVQQQWQRVLGVTVKLEQIERKAYYARRKAGDFQIVDGNWVGDFNDPINFLEIFRDKAVSANCTGWENMDYTKKLDQSDKTLNSRKRHRLMLKAEKILMDEMPIIPVFFYTYTYMKKKNVHNIFLSNMGHLDFKWAFLSYSPLRL